MFGMLRNVIMVEHGDRVCEIIAVQSLCMHCTEWGCSINR